MSIEPVTDIESGSDAPAFEDTIKVACYADTGARKTLQAGYLIEAYGAENVGILSCEHGLNTIKSYADPRFVKTVENLKDLQAGWKWLKETFNKPNQWGVVDGGSRVLQWVHDEVFGQGQRAWEKIVADGVRLEDLDPELRKAAAFVTKSGELNTQQMWIRVATNSTRLLDAFVRLKCSSYWTFWEEQSQLDQFRKGPPWKPDTPGKGSFDAVKGAFDYVFRLTKEQNGSTAHFTNNGKQYAKTRDDWHGGIKVPEIIPNFNLAEFVSETLRGGK